MGGFDFFIFDFDLIFPGLLLSMQVYDDRLIIYSKQTLSKATTVYEDDEDDEDDAEAEDGAEAEVALDATVPLVAVSSGAGALALPLPPSAPGISGRSSMSIVSDPTSNSG